MELRHLRYFAAAAQELTLVAAAKRLGVAQPALTRQIHALERELGVELLERGPKGIALTPAGEVTVASARHVLRQVDAAAEWARGSGQGTAGRCVICAGVRSLASGLIGRIVERARQRYSDIEIGVIEGSLERQRRALQLGAADVGIGVPVPKRDPEIESETIDHDVFDAIAIASGHPLASRKELSLAELAGETLITWRSEVVGDARLEIDAEFARHAFRPAAQREYDSVFAVSAAVEAGQGWALIFRELGSLAPRGTTIIPVSDLRIAMPHALLWRRSERRPVVRTVMDVMREVVAEERAARVCPAERLPFSAEALPSVNGTPHESGPRPSAALELRHLRYFCAVVDAGSFGRAAEQLGLTQPALSRQVADLERIVGIPLLERTARGVSVTPAGEAFCRRARRILEEVDSLPAETQRARRGVTARCVVASVPTSAARKLLTALLRECAQELPELELVFDHAHTPAQPAELRSGHVDLGICHASPLGALEERGIERSRLMNDTLNCALVAESSPFAERASLSLHELADTPFMFPQRAFQPAMYDEVFAIFDALAFAPRVDATYDGLQTIWAMVAEGHGWAVGFESQREAPPRGTVAVLVEHLTMPWGLDLLTRQVESRSLILDVADRLHRIARESA
ncbi:MAG: LysR family transcriptional regulator [Gemmatimonadaceae bacterium]